MHVCFYIYVCLCINTYIFYMSERTAQDHEVLQFGVYKS